MRECERAVREEARASARVFQFVKIGDGGKSLKSKNWGQSKTEVFLFFEVG